MISNVCLNRIKFLQTADYETWLQKREKTFDSRPQENQLPPPQPCIRTTESNVCKLLIGNRIFVLGQPNSLI